MKLTAFLVLTILGAGTAVARADDSNPQGGVVFHKNCAGCHGQDGKAQTFIGKRVHAADLTSGGVQSLSDGDLTAVVKAGKGKMPAFGQKLSEDEIRSVVAYVRQLGAK